jgi:hypothetical protein
MLSFRTSEFRRLALGEEGDLAEELSLDTVEIEVREGRRAVFVGFSRS